MNSRDRCIVCDEEPVVYKGLCEFCMSNDPVDRPPRVSPKAKKKQPKEGIQKP